MLIIGHRGAAGLSPQNTVMALRAGMEAGADILEFDIRFTADKVPILAHDPIVAGRWIGRTSFDELRKASPLIATLQEVLDEFFGHVLLNIELKTSGNTDIIYGLVGLYITRPEDWDNVLFSSFKPKALVALRSYSDDISLAQLHHINPFSFMRTHRHIQLSAVGFHRLLANPIAIAIAKKLDLFTYVYTVDRPETALRFARKDIDGLVTNFPDKVGEAFWSNSSKN